MAVALNRIKKLICVMSASATKSNIRERLKTPKISLSTITRHNSGNRYVLPQGIGMAFALLAETNF
jgi:hypothetical protein